MAITIPRRSYSSRSTNSPTLPKRTFDEEEKKKKGNISMLGIAPGISAGAIFVEEPKMPELTEDERTTGVIRKAPKLGLLSSIKNIPLEQALPFEPISAIEAIEAMSAAKRLKEDKYKNRYKKDSDRDVLKRWQAKNASQDEYTLGGNVAQIVGRLPAFGIEMMTTGAATAPLRKYLFKESKKAIKNKIARKALTVSTDAAARTAMSPHRIIPSIATEKLIKGSEDGEAIAKGIGDVAIEMASELSGPTISKAIKPIGKFAKKVLPKRTSALFGKIKKAMTPKGEVAKILKRSQYQGIPEEYIEERVGSIARAITGIEGQGNILERLKQSIPTTEQSASELLAFSIPGLAGSALSKAENIYKDRKIKVIFGKDKSTKLKFKNTEEAMQYGQSVRGNNEAVKDLMNKRKSTLQELDAMKSVKKKTRQQLQNFINKATESQLYREALQEAGVPIDAIPARASEIKTKEAQYDQENLAGLSSQIEKGKEPIKQESIETTGDQEVGPGGIFQTQREINERRIGEVADTGERRRKGDLEKLREDIEGLEGSLYEPGKKYKKDLKEITVADFNQEKMPLKEQDIKVEKDLISKANELQSILGRQIVISSGYRTKEYNEDLKKRGYKPDEASLHLSGRALDINLKKSGLTHEEVYAAAKQIGLDMEDVTLTPYHAHLELPTEGTPTKLYKPSNKINTADLKEGDRFIAEKGSSVINTQGKKVTLKEGHTYTKYPGKKEGTYVLKDGNLVTIDMNQDVTIKGSINAPEAFKGGGMRYGEQPIQKSTKSIVRETTGQKKIVDVVGEDVALKEGLRKEEKGARAGVRFGKITERAKQEKKIAALKERIKRSKDMEERRNLRTKLQAMQSASRTGFIAGKKEATAKFKIEQKEKESKKKERVQMSKEVKELSDKIMKIKTKNLPIEYQDAINELRGLYDLKKRTGRTLARRNATREFIQRMKDEGEEVNIPQDDLEMLEKTTLNDLTVEDLRQIYTTLKRLEHLGKLKDKLISGKQEREFETIKTKMISTITKGEPLKDDTVFQETAVQKKNRFVDKAKDYITQHIRTERLIEILDGLRDKGKGVFEEQIWDNAIEAEDKETELRQESIKAIQDIHSKLDIGKIYRETRDAGRLKKIPVYALMKAYAYSFNELNRLHLYGSGLDDVDIENIRVALKKDEKEAVQRMIKYFDDVQYPALNEVYMEMEGVRLKKEELYFPIDNIKSDITEEQQRRREVLHAEGLRRPATKKGQLKERLASAKPIGDWDYFESIWRNVMNANHYIAFEKITRDARKVFTDADIKAAIEQNHSKQMHSRMLNWVRDIAWGSFRNDRNALDKLLSDLRVNYSTAVLGFNLLTVLKQPISFVQGADFVGNARAAMSAMEFTVNPKKMIDMVNKKSIMMRTRGGTQEKEFIERTRRLSTAARFGQSTSFEKVKAASMVPIFIADKMTTTVLWHAQYTKSIQEGFNESDARKEADKLIRKTQPMGGLMHLPEVMRSGSVVQKALMAFKNQPNQNFNILLEAAKRKQWGRLLRMTAIPAFVLASISLKRTPTMREYGRYMIGQWLGGLLAIGSLVDASLSKAEGKYGVVEGALLPPAAAPIVEIGKGIAYGQPGRVAKGALMAKGVPVVGAQRLASGRIFGKRADLPKKKKSKKARPFKISNKSAPAQFKLKRRQFKM